MSPIVSLFSLLSLRATTWVRDKMSRTGVLPLEIGRNFTFPVSPVDQVWGPVKREVRKDRGETRCEIPDQTLYSKVFDKWDLKFPMARRREYSRVPEKSSRTAKGPGLTRRNRQNLNLSR